jgi:predicted AAA+ superfamily ATPase
LVKGLGVEIIFDELHKYLRWKQWIKGVYDSRPSDQQYLVTGSARLDVYRRGGDSLMGRYHYWRLHPFTLDEIPSSLTAAKCYQRLLTVGGFPETLLSGDEREARRWRRERFDRVLREDVRDLENIHNIQSLHLFIDALRSRVGQLISLANLARDLEISPKTAKSWLALCERIYICFSIYPLTTKVPRAIRKPAKVYFYDNADTLTNHDVRLENLVATTLLKRLQFIEDFMGYRCQLHYIRDKDSREVDFVTVCDGIVEDLIEVKWSNANISSALKYYSQLLKPKRVVQIVDEIDKPYHKDGILVTTAIDFFTNRFTWPMMLKSCEGKS